MRFYLCLPMITFLFAALLVGCDNSQQSFLSPATGDRGDVSISVNWPEDVANATRVIPAATTRITVTLTQGGVTKGTLTITRPTSTGTIRAVPVGAATVTAFAYNASDGLVASGSTSVTVVENTAVPARLTLIPCEGGGSTTNPIDGAAMVWVPSGSFTMGSIDGAGYSDEWPAHQVIMSGYWIYRYEVTIEQYRAFCAATGRALPSWPGDIYSWAGKTGWTDLALQQHPIVNVTWDDAKAYADWAGVQLPTEAQWEYAARGPQGHNYPWGGTATAVDWYNGWDPTKCSNMYTTTYQNISTWPVGSFPTDMSWCGTLDMAGNVWEWCTDWYSSSYYSMSPSTNPTGPVTGTSQVLRGGSWYSDIYYQFDCRSVSRRSSGGYWYNMGFRCVTPSPGP